MPDDFDIEGYRKAIEQEFEATRTQYSDAKELLEAHTCDAAAQIIIIMNHSPDARVRLSAARYLLDNTLFAQAADEDALKGFIDKLNAEAPKP